MTQPRHAKTSHAPLLRAPPITANATVCNSESPPGALSILMFCCAPYLISACEVFMQLSELWIMSDIYITRAPSRWSTSEEVDRENITVWPLFTLEPDILTGVTGFTK